MSVDGQAAVFDAAVIGGGTILASDALLDKLATVDD